MANLRYSFDWYISGPIVIGIINYPTNKIPIILLQAILYILRIVQITRKIISVIRDICVTCS